MPKPFSYPELKAIFAGESVILPGERVAIAKRRIGPFATRSNKRFAVATDPHGVVVTRLPVTDSELPGVA